MHDAVIDSATNSLVQLVGQELRRERHPGGLGDSRPLRADIRVRLSGLASEMVDPDVAILVSRAFEFVPEWVSLVRDWKHP